MSACLSDVAPVDCVEVQGKAVGKLRGCVLQRFMRYILIAYGLSHTSIMKHKLTKKIRSPIFFTRVFKWST